jgi:hypothetical protein
MKLIKIKETIAGRDWRRLGIRQAQSFCILKVPMVMMAAREDPECQLIF